MNKIMEFEKIMIDQIYLQKFTKMSSFLKYIQDITYQIQEKLA